LASVPSAAFGCPRCQRPGTPAPGPQICAGCGKPYALHAGAALDPNVVPPPPDPTAERVKVRSAAVVTYRLGVVDVLGVSEGMADPVTGLIPIDEAGVAYTDIFTVTVWRKIDIVELVVASLIPLPLTLLFLWGAFSAPGFLVGALLFGAIGGWMLYRALGARANHVRVVGRYRTIKVRFDRPIRRRQRFHAELLRRAGIAPSAIP
jgi:hypothetical protein